MKRRWLAVLLALLMVMGTVGMAAAEVGDDVEAVLTAEEDEDDDEEQGPPAHIQKMLDMKANQGEELDDKDGEQGPPAFVLEMLKHKNIHIMNKSKLKIHGNPFVSDLPPVIKHGRTLIPVGAVVKSLGAKEVKWDGIDTVTIIKGDTTIELVIGEDKYTIYKNGEIQVFTMDTAAEILGNRTFVPLKFIAEALGEKVKWNPEDRSITIGQQRAAEAKLQKDDEEAKIEVMEEDNGDEEDEEDEEE